MKVIRSGRPVCANGAGVDASERLECQCGAGCSAAYRVGGGSMYQPMVVVVVEEEEDDDDEANVLLGVSAAHAHGKCIIPTVFTGM